MNPPNPPPSSRLDPSPQAKSPFKFLAPYSSEDKDAFWGRDAEIKELYEILFATNVVLLYGPSGTGKTSLIQCGLSKKFSGPDWMPLMIRRGESFMSSIKTTLQNLSTLPADTPISEHIIRIYTTYYRPVYLFFDQFEEIFTLAERDSSGKIILDKDGKLAAVKELLSTIQQLAATLPCKVVFSFREEFLGQLYNYEQYLPTLFDFRLRVEPMNAARIDEVLEGSFKHFNITCDPPEIARAIADNLLEGKATSQLAYLQVYMDALWKTAFRENLGNVWTANTPPPPVTITTKTLDKVGDVRKVLEVYLQEQEEAVAKSVGIQPSWVGELLDRFVTDDGTKRPIHEDSPKLNSKHRIDNEQLARCLAQLQEARLLRKDNQYYELAHDTLAGILANKRTASQRMIKEITRSIRTSYNLPTEGEAGYLNEEYVSLFQKYKPEITEELTGNEDKAGIIAYIEDSRVCNEERKRALQDKNKKLRQSLTRSRRAATGIFVLLAVSLAVVYFAWLVNNNSTALYWVSEAEKMIPARKLRLLSAAINRTNEKKIITSIRDQIVKTFNGSRGHGFTEKRRFDNVIVTSANQAWAVSRHTDADGSEEWQVWNTQTGESYDFLKEEKNIGLTGFSADGCWLLTSNEKHDRYLIWETASQRRYDALTNEKDLSAYAFSGDGKWLYARNANGGSRVRDLINKRWVSYLDREKKLSRAVFSSDSKWLLTLDDDNHYKVWNTTRKQLSDSLNKENGTIRVDFSEDGKWLIQEAKNVSVQDVATRRVPPFLKEAKDIIQASFSTNGNWLITLNSRGQVRLWNVAKGRLSKFQVQTRDIEQAKISGNGKWLLTSNPKSEYLLWDTTTGAVSDSLKREKGIHLSVFSPDGNWLLIRNSSNEYVVWETARGVRHDFLAAEKEIAGIWFSANSRWLLTRTKTKGYRVWEIASGKPWDFIKAEGTIQDVHFTPDGNWLCTLDDNRSMKAWEIENNRNEVFVLGKAPHDSMVFSDDEKWLPMEDSSGNIHLLATGTGQRADLLKGQKTITETEFLAKGKWLRTQDAQGKVMVWDISNGKQPDFLKNESAMRDAVFSQDGQWIIGLSQAGRATLWETASGQKRSLPSKESGIWFADLSPDGKWLVTKNEAEETLLWETHTLKEKHIFPNHGKSLRNLRFSADGKWLVSTDSASRYQLWDMRSGKPHNFLFDRKRIQDVRFSADGKWLITQEKPAACQVWEIATGKAPDSLKTQKGFRLAQFSNTGKFLLTTDPTGYYRVWDMAVGGGAAFLQSGKDLTHAEFSADDRWLLTKNDTGGAVVWETATGRKYNFLKGEKNIGLADFSTDGKYLATASDKRVTTWEIARGKPVQWLYLNATPKQIKLVQNCNLYVDVDGALIKTDFTNEGQSFFSYGNHKSLDYTYDEVDEWMKVFGDDYLGQLDTQTRQKYRIGKKFNLMYDMLKTFWNEFTDWIATWGQKR